VCHGIKFSYSPSHLLLAWKILHQMNDYLAMLYFLLKLIVQCLLVSVLQVTKRYGEELNAKTIYWPFGDATSRRIFEEHNCIMWDTEGKLTTCLYGIVVLVECIAPCIFCIVFSLSGFVLLDRLWWLPTYILAWNYNAVWCPSPCVAFILQLAASCWLSCIRH
jgi:hypothetical protein